MGWINQRDRRNSGVWDGLIRDISGTAGMGLINSSDIWNTQAWDVLTKEISGTVGHGMDQPER